jgi:hypothetical protein
MLRKLFAVQKAVFWYKVDERGMKWNDLAQIGRVWDENGTIRHKSGALGMKME